MDIVKNTGGKYKDETNWLTVTDKRTKLALDSYICRLHIRILPLDLSYGKVIFWSRNFYPYLIPERTWSAHSSLTCQ